MALKTRLTADEYAKVPDAHKGLYVAKGDVFDLDTEPVGTFALEDIGGLQRTVSTLRAQVDTFKGLDPAAARTALSRIPELEAELAKREQAIADLESRYTDHVLKSAALSAISKHQGDAELLMPHVRSMLRAVKGEDGTLVVRVLNSDGTDRLSQITGSTHNPMDPEELVGSALRNKFPGAFPGTNSAGSGAMGSRVNGSGGVKVDPSLSPVERMRLAYSGQGLSEGRRQ